MAGVPTKALAGNDPGHPGGGRVNMCAQLRYREAGSKPCLAPRTSVAAAEATEAA
jgi:hypothetical protein